MSSSKSKTQDVPDLTQLQSPTEDTITGTLRVRFEKDAIYTRINDSILVALNPYKSTALSQASQDYVAEYKEILAESIETLPPHVFQIANQAYLHMRRTGVDQSILLSGETGSGKTEAAKSILHHLIALSSQKKESKLQSLVMHAQVVLEAFGHCKTSFNENASRVGKYVELQYNERGKIVGAKTLNYLFEKRRVVKHAAAEENFHAFYYLMAGASQEEKSILRLNDATPHRYLGRLPAEADTDGYESLKVSLRALGIGKRYQARIMQLLACLLHLGDLEFVDGGSRDETSSVKNAETLDVVADFLGVDPNALMNALIYKTKLIKKDVTSIILNAEEVGQQRDELVVALYSLLFSWIIEQINTKLCKDMYSNVVGVLDLPGPQTHYSNASFDNFCTNYAHERLYNYMLRQLFETDVNDYRSDGLVVPDVPYFNNAACVELIERPKHGLIDITNHHSKSTTRDSDAHMLNSYYKYNEDHDSFATKMSATGARMFVIQHYSGQVSYNPSGFIDCNKNILYPDFVTLFRGGDENPESYNTFLVGLFADNSIHTENHPSQADAILNAQQSNQPSRSPSMRRTKSKRRSRNNQQFDDREDALPASKEKKDKRKVSTALSQLRSSLDDIMTTLDETMPWFIFCLRPCDALVPNMFDPQRVRAQVRFFGLAQIAERMQTAYTMSYFHDEFCTRYGPTLQTAGVDVSREPRDQCEAAAAIFGWFATQAAIGNTRIFLSETAWRQLEDQLRVTEKEDQKRQKELQKLTDTGVVSDPYAITDLPPGGDHSRRAMAAASAAAAGLPMPHAMPAAGNMSVYSDDQRSFVSDDERDPTAGTSHTGSDGLASSHSGFVDMKAMMASPQFVEEPHEIEETSSTRKGWLTFVWIMTWWIPSKFLEWCGHMRRSDVRTAWREKLTLCMMIFLLSAFIIWFLVFFGMIICPSRDVFSPAELQAHSDSNNGLVAIRGEVFDLTSFAPHHYASDIISMSGILAYAGTDASYLFPIQVSAVCQGTTGSVPENVGLNYTLNLYDANSRFHDFRAGMKDFRPDWYYEKMTYLRRNHKRGEIAFKASDLKSQASRITNVNGLMTTRKWAYIDDEIFDLTMYIEGGLTTMSADGQATPGGDGTGFMHGDVVDLFRNHPGTDISDAWNGLALDSEMHDKFVICQVPCYTEDDESIKKTIDSIATQLYDDKRKLMFIICDGMIVGGGNDRPTPRIVLDVLGHDPNHDPDALSFLSVGMGAKQHNMGKVYSGLYEIQGRVVPYIVVVKVGKPSERQKPGNRGKRDSQLILMRFLNKVHYNAPMTPMELEMYHQIKNVIGVNPSYYEFVLMVDADTEVHKEGLSRMVSVLMNDSRIIGLCGETLLSNAKDTWVTMIQVYEYFISHYMIKAFESLFGTVTCLPGCFTIYRIRSATKNLPLLISNEVIEDYQINKVDTLHKKNLLYLGEDRYLTTLILKHFPTYKTKFTPDAKCQTNAPDRWSVLVSQRRRWINSTIHNLGELIHLPQLCGFCCFSMRFVVMLDLISTLGQPAVVGYMVYLIYSLATSTSDVPIMTIITIAAMYGLQALIFLAHRKWDHIVWMLVSICAIPVFSFLIPIYAYWHFDDFSWGNTRVVLGDKGHKKKAVGDEGKFDPTQIPVMTWEQYEESLLAMGDFHQDINNDTRSVTSRGTYYSTGFNRGSPSSVYSYSNNGSGQPQQRLASSYMNNSGMMAPMGAPQQYYPASPLHQYN
ncbi:chitin synthase-domain-containing protein [Dichotomocladium elegans]|nr:chitin synthase-domain-containing protein [Dichotomocladium elegans]